MLVALVLAMAEVGKEAGQAPREAGTSRYLLVQ
jgi:hypothetical protein